jgi:hypothetical protein
MHRDGVGGSYPECDAPLAVTELTGSEVRTTP